jgi:hypothetical protein
MLRLLITLAAIPAGSLLGQASRCGPIADTARIHEIGTYSDMRFTEEHAYGNMVELWRAGDCVFGLFQASSGLAGDTPTGNLTAVTYEPKTGHLEFTAKLTMGLSSAAGSTALVPSRDLFVFTGRLESKALRGRLRQSNGLRPELPPVEQAIILPRLKQDDVLMLEAWSYGEWHAKAESILQFRGPKW